MNYLSQIIKGLRARKSLTLLNVSGLAVCIGAALLILLYVRFELSFDNFHDDGDRIYRAESRLYEGDVLTDNWATTTFGHGPVMSRTIPGIENFVRVTAQDREQEVTYADRQFIETAYCYTEPSFFEMFNIPITAGNSTGQLAGPNTAVITRWAATRYFGESNPIGKVLTFKTPTSEQHFEVTGIIDDMPRNSHLRYDFLLSYSTIPEARRDIWFIHGVYTYLKLAPGWNPDDIETAFARISPDYRTAALQHKDWKIELIPLRHIHLTPRKSYEKETKGNRVVINILTAMAVALLLIGWVNALNLTVARSLERSREFGLHKVFGASRRSIITRGLLESALLNLLALTVAAGLLELLLPFAVSWTGTDFTAGMFDSPALPAAVGVIFTAGVLFVGLYPAIMQTRIKPSDFMRGQLLNSRKGTTLRRTLTIAQFIASFVFISGTLIVIRQVDHMQKSTSDDAFRRILIVRHPSSTDNIASRVGDFKKRLEQQASVKGVAVSGAVPGIEVANYFTNRPFGSDISEVKLMQMFAVDHDYLDIYRPEYICGRGFSENHGNELNKVVINEEAARMLGYSNAEDALGQQIAMEVLKEPLEVIGVVRNYHQQSPAEPFKPIIFFIKERVPIIATPYISIMADTEITPEFIDGIERVYKTYFPNAAFSYFRLTDYQNEIYKSDRNFSRIFICASVLAVFVACLGLWIMTLFSTMVRVREIGIRKVLGAGKLRLFGLLTRELALLIMISTAIGAPLAAILMSRWLDSYAFHIALPWQAFLTAFMAIAGIALLTVLRRVCKVIAGKPMRILRNE